MASKLKTPRRVIVNRSCVANMRVLVAFRVRVLQL